MRVAFLPPQGSREDDGPAVSGGDPRTPSASPPPTTARPWRRPRAPSPWEVARPAPSY